MSSFSAGGAVGMIIGISHAVPALNLSPQPPPLEGRGGKLVKSR